jgi:hypothetical protein
MAPVFCFVRKGVILNGDLLAERPRGLPKLQRGRLGLSSVPSIIPQSAGALTVHPAALEGIDAATFEPVARQARPQWGAPQTTPAEHGNGGTGCVTEFTEKVEGTNVSTMTAEDANPAPAKPARRCASDPVQYPGTVDRRQWLGTAQCLVASEKHHCCILIAMVSSRLFK